MTRIRALAALALLATFGTSARAAEIRIGIIQANAGEARKYQPLLEYLSKNGISATFVTAPDHRAAAEMFARGAVDAMFGGSGVAGVLMLKGLAEPMARPVSAGGPSSYHGVVITTRGGPKFDGTGAWFAGKRVIFSSLASAGEYYFQSFSPPATAVRLRAASHGAAIDALARGQADVAVVKNHVWEAERAKYPTLEQVGEDTGENPDGSLVVSRKLDPDVSRRLVTALTALGGDASPAAAAAKGSLKITGYAPAMASEYAHTLELLKKAGVTKDFQFRF